jgi:hypothetical protein
LKALELSSLELDMGVGHGTLELPAGSTFEGSVEGAIGQFVILVPKGVGVRIKADTGFVVLQVPGGYEELDEVFTSPNYSSADHRIDLDVSLAIGNLVIEGK